MVTEPSEEIKRLLVEDPDSMLAIITDSHGRIHKTPQDKEHRIRLCDTELQILKFALRDLIISSRKLEVNLVPLEELLARLQLVEQHPKGGRPFSSATSR